MMDRYTPAPNDDCGCAPHPDPKHDPRCPPCEPPPVCELECLTKPEFHCGQELTEDDLNALVRWTDRRLARVRYHDGWGVVCGLDLCIDPRCPTRVRITPGYAITCCGDDLVLCDPACIDLRDYCPDPCRPDGNGDKEREAREREVAETIAKRLGMGPLPFQLTACTPVDICLKTDAHPVVSMPHPGSDCGCGCDDGHIPKDPCAVTRRKEGASVVLCRTQDRPDPAKRFLQDWEGTVRVEKEIVRELEGRKDDSEAIAEVLRKLKFCSLGVIERILEELTADDLKQNLTTAYRSLNLEALLFWYVIDRRLRLRDRPCHDCDDDQVCIARAWLFSGLDRHGKRVCFIGWLDTADPVRRRLAPARLPAPPGSVNLAEIALGRAPEDAALALSAAGIEVAGSEELHEPPSGELVRRLLSSRPFASWSQSVTLVAGLTCHGPRVLGWYLGKRAVVGEPAASERPSTAAVETPPLPAQDVMALRQIGNARAPDLRAKGIKTVGDVMDADPALLTEIAAGWRNLGRDMTPEKFADWLIAHAKAYGRGES